MAERRNSPNVSQKIVVDDGALRYIVEMRGFRVPEDVLGKVRETFEMDTARTTELLQKEGFVRIGTLPQ